MYCINIKDDKFYIDYKILNDITYVEFYKYKEYKMLDNLFIIFVRNLFKNDLFSEYVEFEKDYLDNAKNSLISNTKFINLKQSKKIGDKLILKTKKITNELSGIKFFCVLHTLYTKIYKQYINSNIKTSHYNQNFPFNDDYNGCKTCTINLEYNREIKNKVNPNSSCFFHKFEKNK